MGPAPQQPQAEYSAGSAGRPPDERSNGFSFDRGVALFIRPQASLLFREIRPDRRSGDVHAELEVRGRVNGVVTLLCRARLNLVSPRAKADIAKYLGSRLRADWPALLEESSWQVVDRSRQGRPALLLRDAKPLSGGRHLVHPLLEDKTFLFGDGSVGKSLLFLALGLSMHSGRELIEGLKPARILRVAYADAECDGGTHRRRAQALWGPGELPDLLYIPMGTEGPLSHQVDRLRGILREHRTDVLLGDSVGLMTDGPPEDAASALAFMQAVNRLEVKTAWLAHVNRSGDTDRPFGSTFWHNSARATWYVRKVQETAATGLDVGLYNRKANDGPLHRPIGLHIEFEPERTVIRRTDISSVPELASGLTVKERIIVAVRPGAQTVAVIAERTGLAVENVRKVVNRDLELATPVFIKVTGDPYKIGLKVKA